MISAPTRPAFAPLERDTMQERVNVELRQAVMRGRFRPGEVLIVRALSDQFGTSHMPVRDALSRLVAEQALEVLPSRSVAVPILSRERCEEIQEMRELLEGHAAALATTRLSDADLALMATLGQTMRTAIRERDAEGYVTTNWRFHFTLYAAAERPTMLHMIESLWLQIGPSLRACLDDVVSQPDPAVEPNVEHHDEMLEALRRRDPEAVRRGIGGDLRSLTDYLVTRLLTHPATPRPVRRSV